MVFVFAVTAALASLVTESIARFLGLRGAYLLSGLRELVDSGDSSTVLADVKTDYTAMREIVDKAQPPADPAPADKALSGEVAAPDETPADKTPTNQTPADET